ncbi:MAG TPA: hypothetical protein VGV09_10990 [Steroidobacteraceae bacterium]|nr:hypothetical protein [Steroidobacteraceae bacterium]
MRITSLIFAIGIASCALAMAAPAAEPPQLKPHKYERLDSQDALDSLKSANPRHYAIARKILADANEICDAQKAAPMRMKFEAQDVGCASSFWYTSNPPKRILSFRIDDTVYSALVEMRNLGAKLRPADPALGTPILKSGK